MRRAAMLAGSTGTPLQRRKPRLARADHVIE
jgi:hypothetical protein